MFRIINKLKNRKGFTLIELIVVLAVLAIIMAIAIPRFIGVQEQAKVDADLSTFNLIKKAAELYYITEDDSSFTAQDLITKKYMDDFDFQSTTYLSTDPDDVDISIADDAATISVSGTAISLD